MPPKPESGQVVPTLKVAVLSAEGLRSAEGIFVEVQIEGQSDSNLKTPTVAGCAKTHSIDEKAQETFEAKFQCEFDLKEYTEGAAITFTVRDSSPTKTEILGRVTMPATMIAAEFWGKLPLTDAGEGYEASLEVRVGWRHILVRTAQEITNVIAGAVGDIQETIHEAKGPTEEVCGDTAQEVFKGLLDLSTTEVKEAVSRGAAKESGIAAEVAVEVENVVKDDAAEVYQVVEDALVEVKQTKGTVCCECWC